MSAVQELEAAEAVAAPKSAPDHPNGDATGPRDEDVVEPARVAEVEAIPLAAEDTREGSGDQRDVLEGETEEEALQRRIDEGNVGKGETLRRWKDTEEKQRRVETGRYESKVRRYGQIYEEVRALRKETRLSVQDLRERYKKEGVIQNKDQFIVRLIAQERNEQEGKVAAIRSLQQWRLTDVELHNFLNRCHKRGLEGKLDLALQWAHEQEAVGGEVNFKEGLAFYSSIGIIQPRSSAQSQQQWREWREWEDAMSAAIEKHNSRGHGSAEKGVESGPDASCNEDSTVCNSPWSSERGGGGGSVGGVNGNLRNSSSHGEGDAAGGYGTSRFYAGAGMPEPLSSGPPVRLRRGRATMGRDSPRQKRWWQWRSYSPPGPVARRKSGELRKAAEELKKEQAEPKEGGEPAVVAAGTGVGEVEVEVEVDGRQVSKADVRALDESPDEVSLIAPGTATAAAAAFRSSVSPIPLPLAIDPDTGAGRPGESVVRAAGGYLPPRHPLAGLQLSPTCPPGDRLRRSTASTDGESTSRTGSGGDKSVGSSMDAEADGAGQGVDDGVSNENNAREAVKVTDGDSTGGAGGEELRARALTPQRRALVARGVARTRAKGPAEEGTPREDDKYGPAPTEEGAGPPRLRRGFSGSEAVGRGTSLSGVLSELADWLMPGMEGRRRAGSNEDVRQTPHLSAPGTPTGRETRSAPVTPRGRAKISAVLREGGWFYNGDSDYSSSDELDGYKARDAAAFWGDDGASDPPSLGGGGGLGILARLRMLFT